MDDEEGSFLAGSAAEAAGGEALESKFVIREVATSESMCIDPGRCKDSALNRELLEVVDTT